MNPNLLLLGTTIGALLMTPVHVCLAQSTLFTYQGRLNANGAPANGLYDFRFSIYKTPTNGLLIAGPVTNIAVGVTNGLFTTSLDFGHLPFLGDARWMDYAVRTNGSANAFSTLTPRIRIAAAPYPIPAATLPDAATTPPPPHPRPPP